MSNAIQQAAEEYISLGWAPIPLKARDKHPAVKWKKFDAKQDGFRAFAAHGNIGIRLGASSGGLVDIDLDWPEAAKLAESIFADFPAFGRASSPASHRLLYIEGEVAREAFTLPATASGLAGLPGNHALCVSELRGTGHYTMFPPSVHPSGEAVSWVSPLGSISRLSKAVALRKLGLVSALAVCLRFYPVTGTRDDMHMALAGMLARAGYGAEEIDRLNILLAEMAGDEEAKSRAKGGRTHSQLAEGKEVTGATRLVTLLGLPPECAGVLNDWLGIINRQILPMVGEAKNERILDPSQPYEWAKLFHEQEKPNLIFFAGEFYDFDGVKYWPLEPAVIRKAAYEFLLTCWYIPKKEPIRFPATKANVDKFFHALEAYLAQPTNGRHPPLWLKEPREEPNELLVCSNCIVHIPTERTMPHTPNLFNLNALDYEYRPDAGEPQEWLKFLSSVWPEKEHQDSVETLQEVMGYLLTHQTHLQKMFFLVGAPRAGKGVILRTMSSLVGEVNVVGMNLSALDGTFGLEPLLGKQIAQFADARLSGRNDAINIVEKLLKISGEDTMTVDRKFKSAVTTKLTARLIFCGNEIPIISDASMALVNRFIFFNLPHSHLGSEDPGLSHRLSLERPQILLWAIEGYRRLAERGYFIQPRSGQEKLQNLGRIASPVKAFIDDECDRGPGFKVRTAELFRAYLVWSEANGVPLYRSPEIFGAKLASACTEVVRSELNDQREGRRVPTYLGLRLKKKTSEMPF
jgi:P4 family phage/plasmid primase-like protien